MTKLWGAPRAGPAVRAPRDGTPSGAASTTGSRCGDLQDWQQVTQTRLGPRSSGVRRGVDLGPSHQHLPRAGCPTGKPVQAGTPSILLHLTKCQAAPGFTSQGPHSCVRVSVSHVHRHTPSHTAFTAQPRPRRKPAACGQGALVLRKGFLGRALPAQVVALWDTLGALIQDRKNNKAPSAGGGRRAPSCPAISASASSRAPSDSSETEASFTSASSLPSLSTP